MPSASYSNWAQEQVAKTLAARAAANQGTTGMSATTANPSTTSTMGSIPKSTPSVTSPAPGTQASAQAWINNSASGQGGLNAYTQRQNERYGTAIKNNDQDLIDRLVADSDRVGYGLSYQATQQPVQTMNNQVSYPQQDAVTNVRSSSDLQQLAQDQTATEKAALLNAINTQIGNVKNNAEYSNQLLQDNRVLEDQALLRNNNPFSGGTNYQLAQVQRGRSIDDTSRAATLENTLGSLQQEITNFDKLTPERQRAIYNELLDLERNFGLNVGQLTGTYGGQRTLSGANQDFQQQLDLANLTGTVGNLGNASSVYGGPNSAGLQSLASLAGTRTLQGQILDRNIKQDNWNAYKDATDLTGDLGLGPQSNWGNLISNAGKGEFTYTAGRDKVADQQWQDEFDRIKEDSGIKNAIAWANNSISQQNANTSSANASTSASSAANSANNSRINQLMDIWQATGSAPAGLEEYGVSAGSPYVPGIESPTPESYDYKSDPDFMADAAAMVKSPGQARTALRENAQAYIDKYGIEGYNYLITTINK